MKDQIIKLRKQGLTKPAIAKQLNISFNTVRYYLEPKTRKSHYHRSIKRRIKYLNELKQFHGNACSLCGYSKCSSALHFHHKNPLTKDFEISDKVSKYTFDKLKKESEKCVLICANCHAEITWPNKE